FISPAGFVAIGNLGKVVLSVEEVGANGASDEVRDRLREQQGLPAEEQSDGDTDQNVNHQCNQAVEVFPPIVDEWTQAHPVNKHEKIPEQDSQRMADELISKAFASRGLQILGLGHHGKGA